MSDDSVTRLNAALEGRYEIEKELGEGGMATVYLARDLRHNRKVALKVLRPELAAVVGAERFLTEIETTANLQHPHILPLFDSGEAGSFLFYVMPYVEGESLREKIQREHQLPVEEALDIAENVAAALQYAHEQGVVHRDIKPANILLSRGEPLVADFGIALAVSEAGGGRITETGLSLGTPHYMSPEQAAGERTLDKRSDVYALGCVLYEMLTGQPPYGGPTAQAVLGRILTGDPTPATEHRKAIPSNVDAAIRKALEKLPADRFGSAAEFGRALRNPSFRHGTAPGAGDAVDAGAWRTRAVALAALSVVLAAGLGWALLAPEPPLPVTRFGIQLPQGQEARDFVDRTFALMPDGSGIVYVGPAESGLQLWFKPRGLDQARPVPGTEGGRAPSPSPDGEWIAFRVGTRLLKVPSVGGATITLSDSINASAVTAGAWLDDGGIVFADVQWRLRRVPAEGGDQEVVYTPPEGQFAYGPVRIPGSTGFVFSACGGSCGPDDLHEIRALDLASGESGVVAPGGATADWASTGHLVFVRPDGSVLAMPFDAGKLEAEGPAVPVLEGVKVDAAVWADFDLADDGTLLAMTGGGLSRDLEFVWVTREGGVTPVDPGWTFNMGNVNSGWSLSPDDSRLAFRAQTEAGLDIWVKELPDGPVSRLTFDPSEERMPRWTPDGGYVTFLSSRGSSLDMWRKRADGVGEAELVYDHEVALSQGFWSPDGKAIVLRTAGTAGVEGGRDILTFRPGQDSAAVPLLAAKYDEWAPIVSQDGHWIAYQSTETGSNEIFVRPFPNVDDGKWQVSDGGGIMPLWSHSGRELFYVNGDRELVAAQTETEPRFRVSGRRVLFRLPDQVQTGSVAGYYDLTSDDRHFLMARLASSDSAPTRLILVQNWLQELKERMGR